MLLGRFWGWEMTNPRRLRIRQIVDAAGEEPVCSIEVVGDGVGARVKALIIERHTELDDRLLDLLRGAVRTAPRPTGARLEPGLTFGLVPPDEDLHPPPGHTEVPAPPRPWAARDP